jgi:hypothetical protein
MHIQEGRVNDKSAELNLPVVDEGYFPKVYQLSENEPHMNPRNGINMGKVADVGEGYHER